MLKDLIKKILSEASSDSSGAGSFITPLQLGIRPFNKKSLQPFEIPVSKYDSPELQYDSYDGSMDKSDKEINKIENKARQVTNKIRKNPYSTFSDDDGGNINPTPGKGLKFVPINEWVEINENTISEDLAVWFGTKKKPKGSKQPKGPWVNICRKKEGGGHPPCGRPDADSKGYPKCRAAGVASKMSDSQKRAACSQKRRAEKSNPKTGTGNSPTMTSYKPRKQNESLRNLIKKILNEGQTTPTEKLTLECIVPKVDGGSYKKFENLTFKSFREPSGQIPGKLYLTKENLSGIPDSPYQSTSPNTMVLNFLKVTNPELLSKLNVTEQEAYLLHYVDANKEYFCTTTKTPSMEWENYFIEKGVTSFFDKNIDE